MIASLACNTFGVNNTVPPQNYPLVVETITDRINAAFLASGLKQSDLAERAGVSKQTVNGWLKGRVENIRPENLFSAADALGINARWLATGKGPRLRTDDLALCSRLAQVLSALDPPEAEALSKSFLEIAEIRSKYRC